MSNSNRFLPPVASAIAIFLLMGLLTLPATTVAQPTKLSEKLQELLVQIPADLPSFTLKDSKGKVFNLENFNDKWTFLFFGYTNCPDVCPETLTEMDTAARKLATEKDIPKNLQYVFISIDPRRDTPALLGQYLSYFTTKFVGATGSIPELIKLANSVNIGFEYGPGDKNYEVAHGSSMLLINPKKQYVARFRAPQYSEDIVAGFKLVYNYFNGKQP